MKYILNKFKIKNRFIEINLHDLKIKLLAGTLTLNLQIWLIFIHPYSLLKKRLMILFYFVEDDYIHELDSFTEMLFSYERIFYFI